MSLAALQGRPLARLLDELRSLVEHGEAIAPYLRSLVAPRHAGLWADGEVLIATPEYIALADRLPNTGEVPAAVFSLIEDVRAAWRRIVVARLREMGERSDVSSLVEAVSTAGSLATELVNIDPSLTDTTFDELERLVLPASACEAKAFPTLLRALIATTTLFGPKDDLTPEALPQVVWDDPFNAWRPGRLLRQPSRDDVATSTYVLTGALGEGVGEDDAMRWVLKRPWGFLLAQVVFTKEAWEAERISGGVTFELDQALLAQFQRPTRVDVVVTLATGEEVRCGTLGELVLQVLAQLGVTIFGHRVTASRIDDQLADAVEAVLSRNVWRFDHGTGGRRPSYGIHPDFSDACYRALGSRSFYRLGSHVTAAIRRVAETWARDRVARAGGSVQGAA